MRRTRQLCAAVASACAAFITLAATPAQAADACALLAQSEAAAVTGQPIVEVMPGGPRRDEDSGGQLSYCTWRAAEAAVVVSVVEFASHDDALKQLRKSVAPDRAGAPATPTKEEPGLGEQAYYGASARGATSLFLQGNKLIGVDVGGSGPGVGAALKESLRAAAKAMAAKA